MAHIDGTIEGIGSVPYGLGRALGAIALISGAITGVIGAVSFLVNGTFEDFLFRVGIAYLVLAACLALYGMSSTQPTTAPPDERTDSEWLKWWWSRAGLGALTAVVPVFLFLSLLAQELAFRLTVSAIGSAGIVCLPLFFLTTKHELLPLLKDLSRASRPCPRCGHPVRAGVMSCPHCSFDFWTVGNK